MEKYKVVNPAGANLRSAAAAGDNIVGKLKLGDIFDGEPDVLPEFVKVISPPPQPARFVISMHVRPVEEKPQIEPILDAEHDAFCIKVTQAAREFGPERNYLMAAAYCGSKNLKDLGTSTSEKVGPFQITAQDWAKGILMAKAKGIEGLTEADRFDWRRQEYVAALLAADCARRLTQALGDDPTFTELYFAQLFGEGAEAVLKGDRARMCSEATSTLEPATTYAKSLKTNTTTSVKSILDGLEKGLVDGLTEALIVINRQPPEIQNFRDADAAPWMKVAREELDRKVAETPDGATSNERIVLYHKAAGIAAAVDETPWCASFVTFCVKQSGIETVPARPAFAPDWRTWGVAVPRGSEPIGTVICWQPGPESTAHVGFLAGGEANGLIDLLGGNQRAIEAGKPDAINIKKFPAEHITARRWFGPLPGAAGAPAAGGAAGGPAAAGPGAAGPGVAADGSLTTFHAAFDDVPGIRWKLTPGGLQIEGEAGPMGSGGPIVTVPKVWNNFQNDIIDAAKEFGVPIELIIATICTESGGNELAERHEPSGEVSVGLMQTLISTARGESSSVGVPASSITAEWLRVPKNSIRAGASYIAGQKGRTRLDPPKVACAYNAGSLRKSTSNRWKMVQTAGHADRFVGFFNDCFVLAPQLPAPSFVTMLKI